MVKQGDYSTASKLNERLIRQGQKQRETEALEALEFSKKLEVRGVSLFSFSNGFGTYMDWD